MSPPPRAPRLNTIVVMALCVLAAGMVVYFAYLTGSAIAQGRHKDFREFFLASEAMREGRDIYAQGVDGYIYPPLLAFLLLPLVSLGLIAATWVWLGLNVAALAASVLAGARAFRERFDVRCQPLMVPCASAAAVLLMSDKLHGEFVFGQSNLWMLLSWTLGLWWLDRRPVAAGIALGFGANLKYLTLAAVPYLIFRKRYKAAAATVGATLAWGLLPALYLGWNGNAACWGKALRGLLGMVDSAAAGDAAARVSDIKGELSLSITSWAVRATSAGGPNVRTLALLGLIGLVFGAAVWLICRRAGVPILSPRIPGAGTNPHTPGVIGLEWTGVLAATMAFGPQTNSRHLVMLMLVYIAAIELVLMRDIRARRWPLVLGLVVLTAGLTLPPGSDSWRHALDRWRALGGPCWCLAIMELTLLWVGLRHLSAAGRNPRAETPPT